MTSPRMPERPAPRHAEPSPRSSYLPAPYESAPDDDLAAASVATLTGALAVMLAVTLGAKALDQVPQLQGLTEGVEPTEAQLAALLTTVGWAAAAVFLGFGAVLLVFRRGRVLVVWGGLIATAFTLIARYVFDWFTPAHPVGSMPVYLAGIGVIVLAALPATGRWIRGRSARRGPIVIGTVSTT
jgi:hypothetical protein